MNTFNQLNVYIVVWAGAVFDKIRLTRLFCVSFDLSKKIYFVIPFILLALITASLHCFTHLKSTLLITS